MVVGIGFPDMLSIAQTIEIVGNMLLTLYFSKKQIQSPSIQSFSVIWMRKFTKRQNL